MGGADQDVHVLDRLAPPAETAAQFDSLNPRQLAHHTDHVESEGQSLIDANAVAGELDELDALEDLLLRLGAEAFQLGDLAALAGRLELVETVDAEVLPERLDLLRTESAHLEHVEQAGRDLLAQVIVVGKSAGG